MLKGFDTYFSNPSYPKGTKDRLKLLCETVWSQLGTGWPPQGSFKEEVADAVWGLIAVDQEKYPDQFPYIDQWVNALTERADELLQCQAEMVRLCVAQPGCGGLKGKSSKGKKDKGAETKRQVIRKKILVEDQEEERPLMCTPPLPTPPPPYVQGDGGRGRGHQRRPSDAVVRPKVKTSHSADGSGQSEEDEGAMGEEESVGVKTRSTTAREEAAKREFMAPLRQVEQQVINQQGQVEMGISK